MKKLTERTRITFIVAKQRIINASKLHVLSILAIFLSCCFLVPTQSYADELPKKYDPRELGLMTPVKTQTRDICWSYAVTSALESYLLKEGESHNFSENYFNYLLATNATGTAGENPYALKINSNGVYLDKGFDSTPVLDTLLDWSGPVNESDFPNTIVGPQPVSKWEHLNERKHVQSVFELDSVSLDITPEENNQRIQKIKSFVYMYGNAIHRNQMYVGYETKYHSQYIPKERVGSVNHVSTIVGWDDSFSKERFVYTPSQDGAFIVKNSWGSNWGDGGYYYISYDDFQLKLSDIDVISSIEPMTNYFKKYDLVHEVIGSLVNLYPDKPVTLANNYLRETKDSEKLSAVSLRTRHENTAYEIYVHPSGKPTNRLDGFIKVKEGIKTEAGTETIKLDSPVTLTGASYSIAVVYRSTKTSELQHLPASSNNDSDAGTSYKLREEGIWSTENYQNYFIAGYTEKIGEQLPSSITLSKQSLQLLVDETDQLTATLTPDYSDFSEIGFKSSDPKIASVSSNGLVTALSSGNIEIQAFSTRNPKIATTVKVTVSDKPKINQIKLSETALSLNKSEKATVTATTLPERAEPEKIIWTSNNPLIATVDTNGIITAQGAGKNIITAMTESGSVKAICTVSVAADSYSDNTGYTSLELATDIRNNKRSALYVDNPLKDTIYLRLGQALLVGSKENWTEFHLTTSTGIKCTLLEYPEISWFRVSDGEHSEPPLIIEYSTDGKTFSTNKPDLKDLEGFRIAITPKTTEKLIVYADVKMRADKLSAEDLTKSFLPLKITSGYYLYSYSTKVHSDGESTNWISYYNLSFPQ